MKRLRRNQEGMTLVEILVVMFLFVLIATFSINFLIMSVTGHAKAQANIEVQEHARAAMQRIIYEVRRAQGFEAEADFDVNLALSADASFDLDMPDAGRDPTIFKVQNGVLTLKQGDGSAQELTADDVTVTHLTFANRSTLNGRSRNIVINLTVMHPDPTGAASLDIEYHLQASAELRNPN